MPHLALPPFPTRRSSDLRLAGLGPEPLSGHYTPQYLYTMARGRRAPVKAFLMDARVVVGAGNIYATEALFMAGIHPRRPAGRIALTRYAELHAALRAVLKDAITRDRKSTRLNSSHVAISYAV